MKTILYQFAFSCLFLFPADHAFAQGDLAPAGAPGPTMKTLDQIEPRTPIDASHTPGGGTAQFIITQPGSYYLSSNIVAVSGKSGIRIQASNVSLDLNGFSLLGKSNAFDGIFCTSYNTNLVVRNGTISGWSNGSGIYSTGWNGIFERLNISGNQFGVRTTDGSQITGCAVNGNLRIGIYVYGSDCLILDNSFAGNNTMNDSIAATIYVEFGSRNRIEGNRITGSGPAGKGIQFVGGTNNFVIRNSVIGGGVNNYAFGAFASSQVVGPLITNTGIITNSNPWANFSF